MRSVRSTCVQNLMDEMDYQERFRCFPQAISRGSDVYSSFCSPRAIRGTSSLNSSSATEQNSRIDSTFDSDASVDLSAIMSALNISRPGAMSAFPTRQEWDNLQTLRDVSATPLSMPRMKPRCLAQADANDWTYDLPDTLARFYRKELEPYSNPFCTWSGLLPPRFLSENLTFSCKVFLGGVPWDVTEESLSRAFSQFGKVRVEWPGKEQEADQPKGYVYLIFESEKRVRTLLNSCSSVVSNNNCKTWFFRLYSKKMKSKEVQVVPWTLAESNFVHSYSQKIDSRTTVFVGAVHGMINAEGLFKIMHDLFGGVAYVGIDTDKFKYPIGSARVTFDNVHSYLRAVSEAYVNVKTPKFSKRLQVDPYLDDAPCSYCSARQGLYFCRQFACFKYFCRHCWILQHQSTGHKPMVRRTKIAGPGAVFV